MNEDGQESLLRAQAREREDRFNKQVQLTMAQHLSELTRHEYGEDIVRHLEEQEVSNNI